MRNESYTQCYLENYDGRFQTAWIESKHAIINHVVKINKDDGWIVKDTFSTKSKEQVENHECDYKLMSSNKG